jgi:hypothetical protein
VVSSTSIILVPQGYVYCAFVLCQAVRAATREPQKSPVAVVPIVQGCPPTSSGANQSFKGQIEWETHTMDDSLTLNPYPNHQCPCSRPHVRPSPVPMHPLNSPAVQHELGKAGMNAASSEPSPSKRPKPVNCGELFALRLYCM